MLVNPDHAYHWVSIRCSANEELSEDDPAVGERVTAQLDRIWTKYTQQPPPYGLRDPGSTSAAPCSCATSSGWPPSASRDAMASALRIAVAGGSLGGLTAALVLRDLGVDVDVLRALARRAGAAGGRHRVPARQLPVPRRAGGLDLDTISTWTARIRYLARDGGIVHDEAHTYRFSSWNTVYRHLLQCFGRERYVLGSEAVGFEVDATRCGWPSPTGG